MIEDENMLVERYKIRSIPMIMFCPTGGEPEISNGVLPKAAIRQIIEEKLLNQK